MDVNFMWDTLNNLNMATKEFRIEHNNICSSCSSTNSFLNDTSNALIICTNCGDVQYSAFDEHAEWNFDNTDSFKKDPSRCGFPINPLLSKSSMSTSIKGTSKTFMKKLHNQISMDHVERSLYHIFEYINRITCDSGNLSSNITEKSKSYYKILSERKLSRGSIRQGLIACSILHACKYHNVTRSVKEISNMCDISVSVINKTNKIFLDVMNDVLINDGLLNTSLTITDLIPRFCNTLDVPSNLKHEIKIILFKLENIIKQIDELNCKTPSSMVCGLLIYVCNINNIPINKKQFVEQHSISVVTINKIVRLLNTYVNKTNELYLKKS